MLDCFDELPSSLSSHLDQISETRSQITEGEEEKELDDTEMIPNLVPMSGSLIEAESRGKYFTGLLISFPHPLFRWLDFTIPSFSLILFHYPSPSLFSLKFLSPFEISDFPLLIISLIR